MNPHYPVGLDKADGVKMLPAQPKGAGGSGTYGTANGPGQVINQFPGSSDPTKTQPEQEDATSPEIERAEQCTITHKLKMTWDDGVDYIKAIGRGLFLQDSYGLIYRVLSAKLNSLRDGQAEVIITQESISFDSPPDEWQVIPVESGIDILKNPRYNFALSPAAGDDGTYAIVGETKVCFYSMKSCIMRMVQTYRDAPFFPSADNINGIIQNNVLQSMTKGADGTTLLPLAVPIDSPTFDPTLPNEPPQWDGIPANLPDGNYTYAIIQVPVNLDDPTDPIATAIAAAKEIISKLWRQEDTPYSVYYQVVLSQYFFAPTLLNPGGIIQSPVGIVPDYFMSPSQDGTDTIFDNLANINPQDYSIDGTAGGADKVNISWLRKADEVEYQRTWFKTSSVWIGSPSGVFDAQLYSSGPRPQNANDYVQMI